MSGQDRGRREVGDESAAGGPLAGLPTWVLGAAPLVLLAALVAVFVVWGPIGVFRAAFPPVEELTITRVAFPDHGTIRVRVVNGGPEPVTVAQVMVDEAFWSFHIEPDARIPRLGSATVEIPYHWVEGDAHEIRLVTSTGLTFDTTVDVATQTPAMSGRYLGTFALLGVYAGVIPVFIGLFWLPFLRRVPRHWMDFALALTIGLLVFLGVDSLHEALETADAVPGAFQGVGLVAVGALVSVLALIGIGRALRGSASGDGPRARLAVAYLVALGIGLHNLGEGLAIGAAYTVGEIALGTFLVVGFALHNTTEGLGIVAPVSQDRPTVWQLGAMGAIAGLPTVAGTWIGAYSYSPTATTLFLAIGAGAIAQVVWEVGQLLQRPGHTGLTSGWAASGMAAGLMIMYLTGLLVAV